LFYDSFFSDFKKLVVDELAQINLKINMVLDNISTLLQSQRIISEKEVHMLPQSDFDEFRKMIPVKSAEDLKLLEYWLSAKEANYVTMVNIFLVNL